jgi:hypothetical protein
VSRVNLKSLTVEQLVERFAEIGIAQYQALDSDEYSKFNRLYGQMAAVDAELKSRPGDARSALMSLYQHPNVQVRLKAASRTLAIAPTEARKLIEEIAASKDYPQAGDAGMSLWALDEGIFKPE